MNNLSNAAGFSIEQDHKIFSCCRPIPPTAIYILLLLFFLGLGVSIFILIVVHNPLLLILLLCISAPVTAFLLWNSFSNSTNAGILFYLHSFPDSDLSLAHPGQLVKVTGVVSCGNVSLESSYEKVNQCIYTSTLLYEFKELGLKPTDVTKSCLQWRVTYCERFSTDFYITDGKSGIRALVMAGCNCKVLPLVVESSLIKTTRQCRVLSSHLRRWLRDRNLSDDARPLRLEEGYVKAGSYVSVIGMLQKQNDVVMIVQPREIISTGCLWQKLLLPADFDGLILGLPKMAISASDSNALPRLD